MSLKEQLLKVVPVLDIVLRKYPEWDGDEKTLLQCFSSKHSDSSPSLSINPHNGKFYCFGCGVKGTSIIGFYNDVFCGGNFKEALRKLRRKYMPSLDLNKVTNAHRKLTEDKDKLMDLMTTRGWSSNIINELMLGWNYEHNRLTIPYFVNSNLVDVKYYDALALAKTIDGKRVKLLNSKGIKSAGTLYPFDLFNHSSDTVWIVEGEPDCILLREHKVNAYTLSGGVGGVAHIKDDYIGLLAGKHIIICFDTDSPGQNAAKKLCEKLVYFRAKSLKNIVLPVGKDVTEFLLKYGGDINRLNDIVYCSDFLIKEEQKEIKQIHLSSTSDPSYIGKIINTEVIVNGKHHTPLLVPKEIEYVCIGNKCESCKCINGPVRYYVDLIEQGSLDWLYSKSITKTLKEKAGLSNQCKIDVTVKEFQILEQINLIPALTNKVSEDQDMFVIREALYLGHKLITNKPYIINAHPSINPMTKESILIVDKLENSIDSISNFNLTEEQISEIVSVFKDIEPMEIMHEVALYFSEHITKIYGRIDLHILMDLLFHSPTNLSFDGTVLPKAPLEVLILGDTRCGKGQVAESLIRYYDLGQMVSGENCTFMGLVGGVQKVGDNFSVVWGAIPINNGRLVIIDEMSGLTEDIISRLSRVRSEGIAEVNKGGISASTHANTRLAWIANARRKRDISSFPNGVLAIQDLIGAPEDIARFDVALIVQRGEVSSDVINIRQNKRTSELREFAKRFNRITMKNILLWVWSRKVDQIVFTNNAVDLIYNSAKQLANKYSPSIPLVQSENIRFKLAKISTAIAGRCFSTVDGKTIIVRSSHVEAAVNILYIFYDKPSMGYYAYSKLDKDTSELKNIEKIETILNYFTNSQVISIIDNILMNHMFTIMDWRAYTATDGIVASKHLQEFQACNAVKQIKGIYIPKPDFILYLKKKKDELNNE